MADTNLNITVTADVRGPKDLKAALKDLLAEIRLVELGFKRKTTSAGDAQLAFAQIEKKVKELGASEKELVGINTSLFHAENRVTEGFRSMASEVKGIHNKMPGMRDQFRDFYREQRTGDRTMREVAQTAGVLGQMIGGEGLGKSVGQAVNMFQQAEFAVGSLGIAAQGAGGKIAAIGAALSRSLGPIALAIAAISGLVWWMNEAKKSAASLAGDQQTFREALFAQAKMGDAEGAIKSLAERIKALRAVRDIEGLKAFGVDMTDDAGFWKLRRELKIEDAKATKKLADEEKKLFDQREKEATRAFGESMFGGKARPGLERGAAARARAGGRVVEAEERARLAGRGAFREPGENARQTFSQVMAEGEVFQNAFNAGIDNMANSISSKIGGAFQSMFGGAESELGQFAGAFISTITDMAMKVAASGLLNLLFPGLGLLGGFAFGGSKKAGGGPVSSGHPYVVGERGPELFVPNRGGQIVSNAQAARFSGGSMGGMQTVHVVGVIRGNDIQLVNAKAGLSRRGRLM